MEFKKTISLTNVGIETHEERTGLLAGVLDVLNGPLQKDACIKAMLMMHQLCKQMSINNAILLGVDGEKLMQDLESRDDDLPYLINALKDIEAVEEKVTVLLEHEADCILYILEIIITKKDEQTVDIQVNVHGKVQNPVQACRIDEYREALSEKIEGLAEAAQASFNVFCEQLVTILTKQFDTAPDVKSEKPRMHAPVSAARISESRKDADRTHRRRKIYPGHFYSGYDYDEPGLDFFDYYLWYLLYDDLFGTELYNEFDCVDESGAVLDEPPEMDDTFHDGMIGQEQVWQEDDAELAQQVDLAPPEPPFQEPSPEQDTSEPDSHGDDTFTPEDDPERSSSFTEDTPVAGDADSGFDGGDG